MRTPALILGACCAFSLTPAVLAADAPQKPAAAHAEAPFAVVNGQAIGADEFAASFNATMRQKFYHGKPPEGQEAVLRKEVANNLINRNLLLAEAVRRGIKPDQDKIGQQVKQQVDAFEARYGKSPNWQDNKARLQSGLSQQLEQKDVLDQLEAAVRNVAPPNEAETRQYYEGNKNLFTEPEKVKMSVILLKVDPSSPTAVWDKAKEEGQAIYQRLKEGADFAQQAKLHSGDPSAAQGGEMGYVHRGMLPEAMHEKIDQLKPGVIAEPMVLLEGVAILRLDARQEPQQRSFEEVKTRAAELLRRERSDANWNELIASLRKKADIKIDLSRFPDIGAEFKTAQ